MSRRLLFRRALAAVTELLGFAAVSIGSFRLATWLGFIVTGALLVFVGNILNPPRS